MIQASRTRYEPLLEIGAGGMATVFVGRLRGAVGFTRLVALKRPHPFVSVDADLVASLRREADLASRLHHANVVGVLDVEEHDGELVLVLEYVEGGTLADLARRLEPERHPRAMLRILLDAAAGLDAAHRLSGDDGRPLGLVHRDVTPSNVLVGTDGVARILDFGIAKEASPGAVDATRTGVLKGKLGYMAPEYVDGREATPRSDLFSLGVVAWEILTGKRLFRGPSEIETLKRIVRGTVPKLASIAPELAPLDPLIARVLSADPERRPPSVGAFAEELEATARAADLVGSHAEVAELVARTFGADLADRRRRLHGRAAGVQVAEERPKGRDAIATASLVVAPSLPSAPRALRRGLAMAAAAALLAALVGAVVLARADRARHDAAAEAPGSFTPGEPEVTSEREVVGDSPEAIVGELPADDDVTEPPSRASTSDPPTPPSRPSVPRSRRHASPPLRSPLVPSKAPPNPYADRP
jgi:eukaryotic-like serine/threonine-protein kinase